MNIIISWSGDRSHKVAQLFHDWIKCVLQSTTPWLSSHDLDRGKVFSIIESVISLKIAKNDSTQNWQKLQSDIMRENL